jgi:hypothetical protein
MIRGWGRRAAKRARTTADHHRAVGFVADALRAGRRARLPERRSWRQLELRSVLGVLAAVIALGIVVLAVTATATVAWNLITGSPLLSVTMNDVKQRCEETGFACNVATSLFFTVGPLLVGSFVFLFLRLRLVRRPLIRDAKERPEDLVETAGELSGKIVGRDDVCNVLQEDLRERPRRRPHVVVGGIGIGKTAVLVRLTQLLAQRGAVPVPIHLRDAHADMDFLDMAKRVFLRRSQSSQWLPAEAERAWSHLCRRDQIVVLADGLEEALADDQDLDRQRDHSVRVAVTQARKRGYPLVIASRPHDALRALDAAVLRLEPLSPEAALEHISESQEVADEGRISGIIDTANVVEAPLYLQIVRELHENGQLRPGSPDSRGADRILLRVNLLDAWIEALIKGKLQRTARIPLTEEERRATVIQLGALACCGLAQDTLEVTFDMFDGSRAAKRLRAQPVYPALHEATREQVEAVRGTPPIRLNMQLAASSGARLGLVEPRRSGVRFPHSILQAYLGSRLIGNALHDAPFEGRPEGSSFVEQAFTEPGRELLAALSMFSRTALAEGKYAPGRPWRSWLADELCAAATLPYNDDIKSLELLAAAVDVDSTDRSSEHRKVVERLVAHWHTVNSRDDATRDVKAVAISRLGEAAHRLPLTERRHRPADSSSQPSSSEGPSSSLYRSLYAIACRDADYPLRLAAARELGNGGEAAFAELAKSFEQPPSSPGREVATERREVTQAWLLPMLVGSAGDRPAEALESWLEGVGRDLPLHAEAALAQGFKHAANRRPEHPYENAQIRAYLAARAAEMVQSARFWFSRLTLVHALSLWALSGTVHRPSNRIDRHDHRAVVNRWIGRDDGKREHPFVETAADLAIHALQTREPERFMWTDESGVATTVGSRAAARSSRARRRVWISTSAGWLALDLRAQQLVADILIVLALAEQGENPQDHARNLDRINREDLPLCISEERTDQLRPKETAGLDPRGPGETCKGGCRVGLCPYPPKGQQPARVELSEAFCRRQRLLLARKRALRSGRAPWQNAPRSDLRAFWGDMEERART